MLKQLLLIFTVFFSVSFLLSASATQPIPDDLQQWQGWVKYQQEYRNCPLLNGKATNSKTSFLCAWPAQLTLDVSSSGVAFTQQWLVIEESKVPLPGEKNYWPQAVTANQQSVVVLEEANRPYVILPKGKFTLKGELKWNSQPDSLLIPSQVALVKLLIEGKQTEHVERRRDRVWLGRESKPQTEQQAFANLRVNRLITDNHPMEMTVAVNLDVGGAAREMTLTQFDLKKLQLKSIDSALNARVDSQGNLLVQVKPGSHQVQLRFKIHGFPSKINLTETGEHWPKQEIWAYQNNERLRSTQIENVAPIDANQGFMSGWSQFPHYVISQGETFVINQRTRGLSHNADSLILNREMWLSFDHQTYYFFDSISGSKSKDWRVNTLSDYRLTQLSNHDQERLITYDQQNRTGAEIRTPTINIKASGEVASNQMKHASGWDMEFASSNVTVNIPPGRKLISISGADSTTGDWVSRWNLVDLFFILITVALVFKVFGILPSIFALMTLCLSYHETNMPMFLWFNFTVALSLAKKINRTNLNKFLTIYKWVSTGLLLLVLLPFLAEQIRFTLHPQLELNRSLGYQQATKSKEFITADFAAVEELAESPPVAESRVRSTSAEKVVVTGSRYSQQSVENSYEQDAVIQAGKGRPDWSWQTASYSWNGPVKGDEIVRLVVLPDYAVKLMRIAIIILSLLWLLSMLSKEGEMGRKIKSLITSTAKSKVTATVFALCLLFPLSSQLHADQIPSEEMLSKLQQRLYPAPECLPDCVNLANATLRVSEQDLTLSLDYHSGAELAALVPNSSDWRIDSLSLNGKVLNHLWKNSEGAWVKLPRGVSELTIRAKLKNKTNLSIQFAEQPKAFLSQLNGWEISGTSGNRMVSNSIQLTRIALANNLQTKNANNLPVAQEQSIEDLILVTRRLNIATQWTIDTYVTRQAPRQGTITTDVPLLSFEQPLEMTEHIKGNKMKVVIPNNSHRIHWRSRMKSTEPLTTESASQQTNAQQANFEMTALNEPNISESWEILVYPNWNINIQGIPAVMPANLAPTSYWVYQYFPRPGEKITFGLTKPPAAKGASVAISKVQQVHTVSKRKTSSLIKIDYRATRAETINIELGEAQLKSVKQDSRAVNLAPVDGVLSLALLPGKHQLELELETAKSIGFKFSLDDIKIDQSYSNLFTQVTLPQNRWLLSASGPGYGPAIVYWGELIFFILLAFGLSKLPFSPLSYLQWLILGLGMSTFSWPALALVSVWLLASEWRRQNKNVFKDHQIALSWLTVFSTVVAVFALVLAVPYGLLQSPDMGVRGNSSYANHLVWFLDQGEQSLGSFAVYTLPLWAYKAMMLIWSTWLSVTLIKWLGWIWNDLADAPFRQSPILKREPVSKKQVIQEKGEKPKG